jgi:beta-galactosidase
LLDGEVPNQVTVSSGSMPDGTRAFFVFNWSWDEQKVALATDAHEPAADTAHVQGSALSLTAWGCRVFIAQTEPTREEA